MYPSYRRRPIDCIALMLGSLLLAAGAFAGDAHQAVKPKLGANGSNDHPASPATASAPAVRRAADNRASGNEGGSPAIL